jgi:membrane-bound lytic murein transglycosylase D
MLKPTPLILFGCILFAGCSQMSAVPDATRASTLSSSSTLNSHQRSPDKIDLLAHLDDDYAEESDEYTDLWNRLRDGYQFGDVSNSRIDKHLKSYLRHPSYIERVTERGNEYLYHIVNELEARNMPLELALLPIVESAFDPFAYSHGRASGMWQFIPSTGTHFGLKQNWWYDGRRDVLASTDAALTYLSQLHKRFDEDWLLALAAYNAGGGNVNKAIRANKRKGKPTDFWSLDLPQETRAYVPRLIAISKIILEPEQYNVTLASIDNQPYFEAVDTGSQIDLAQAALLADVTLDDLYRLNAGFNRWATDPQGPHRLLIPVDKVEDFRAALDELPSDSRVGWERYQVKSGDSLLALAKRFNTSADVIREHNNLSGNLIRIGQTLLIPSATLAANQYAKAEPQRIQKIQNNSTGSSGTRKVNYTVKSGDSLWSIAKQHQVSVGQLAKWNGMAPKDTLKAHQKLVVWTPVGSSTLASAGPSNKAVVRKVAYQVRNGDSLSRIAGKFSLSVNDILRWNPIDTSNYLQPGQFLTLFVDVTRTH